MHKKQVVDWRHSNKHWHIWTICYWWFNQLTSFRYLASSFFDPPFLRPKKLILLCLNSMCQAWCQTDGSYVWIVGGVGGWGHEATTGGLDNIMMVWLRLWSWVLTLSWPFTFVPIQLLQNFSFQFFSSQLVKSKRYTYK